MVLVSLSQVPLPVLGLLRAGTQVLHLQDPGPAHAGILSD